MKRIDRRSRTKRIVIIDGQECALIPLTHDKTAIVDADIFDALNQWNWHLTGGGYAGRFQVIEGKSAPIVMHRAIFNPGDGFQTDHINRNKLDNRRCNLRRATWSENARNKGAQRNNKFGLKGVSFERKQYTAQIVHEGKHITIGRYPSPELAHAAYAETARRLHGEFVCIN